MQQDAAPQHPHVVRCIAERKKQIPRQPRYHAGYQHVFHAKPAEEPRDQHHAEQL